MTPLTTRKVDLLSMIAFGGVVAVFAFGLIVHGASAKVIWDPAAIVIAFGGSLCGTVLTLSRSDLRSLPRVIRKVFLYESYDLDALVEKMGVFAGIARKEGILALERQAKDLEDPFLRRGLQLAVDGTSLDVIEDIMTTELRAMQDRHEIGKKVVDTWATFAPAFGMMGTIMALCIVLLKLDDPKMIGPGMALALLSTFYGVLGCYAVFTPMAKKLERRSREEVLGRKLIIRGILYIQAGDSPKVISNKLISLVKNSRELGGYL